MELTLTYEDVMDFLEDKELLQEKTQTKDLERTYNLLKNIFQALKRTNLYEAYNLMYIHLKLNNKIFYFSLYTYFIIALYISDKKNYNAVLKMLINPRKFVSRIKIDSYFKQFWYYFKNGDLNQAKVYSSILYELSKLGFFSSEEQKAQVKEISQALRQAKEKTNFDYNKVFRGSAMSHHAVLKNPPKHELEAYTRAINELCNFKTMKLRKFGGTIVLHDYDDFKIQMILQKLKQNEDFKCQILHTYEGNKLVVKLHKNEEIDADLLYKQYELSKAEENYFKCETILLKIIENTEQPSEKLYASLAYCLFKQKNITESHKYYELANYLYFEKEGIRPFDLIIDTLKFAETTPLEYFNITSELEDFTSSFGMDEKKLREIRIYLLGVRKMDIDDALYYYKLTDRQNTAVKLAIAKSFITNGEKRKGYEIIDGIRNKIYSDDFLRNCYENFYENRHLFEISKKLKINY